MNSNSLSSFIKKYDFTFFGACIAIFCIGVLNLYSATHSSPTMGNLYKTQILYFAVALVAGGIVSFMNPKHIFKLSYPVYVFNVILLILVLLLGHKGMGAQRWIVLGPVRIQPSEIMKISIVLALARWFSQNNSYSELGIKDLIIPGIITLIPALLIMMEPDLGTGLLILLIFGVITFYKRLKWKTIFLVICLAAVSGSVMYKYGLKEYQRKRIMTFVNPGEDARGSGYNAIQSKIAIGSGRFLGKGFKKSTQASLNYLPENHTDFVFSIFNEEHGFIFALILIGLYFSLLLRFIWLSSNVMSFYDSIVVIGIMSIFFWHTFVNMGMVMGLLPIVGLPLPLMSYGGSSLVTFGICCGVATSISNSRSLF